MTIPGFLINAACLEIQSPAKGMISVDLKWPIAQVLAAKSVLIVRTDPEPGSNENRNIYAIDLDGQILWRVRERRHVYEDSPYTNIELKNGKVRLNNWDGLTVILDPETLLEESEFYGR